MLATSNLTYQMNVLSERNLVTNYQKNMLAMIDLWYLIKKKLLVASNLATYYQNNMLTMNNLATIYQKTMLVASNFATYYYKKNNLVTNCQI